MKGRCSPSLAVHRHSLEASARRNEIEVLKTIKKAEASSENGQK